jgi:cytochrome c oxidase accessory protein FixG
LKYLVFAALSVVIANIFLAWFVGVQTLAGWVTQSPFHHPGPFAVVALTSALVFVDFAWFREQMCTIACPYARLQAVLLDRRSLVVGYDAGRGEPRTRPSKAKGESGGDCIDCKACVVACPTGIDIREGLQLECIACAQCIDACDSIMDRVGRPRGLVRYGSQDELAGQKAGILRPRIVVYPLLLVSLVGIFAWLLAGRSVADVRLIRTGAVPFAVEQDGWISNPVRIKITNRLPEDQAFRIELVEPVEARMVAPINPLPVSAGETETETVFVALPPSAIPSGRRDLVLRLTTADGFTEDVESTLLGPTGGHAPFHPGEVKPR